MQFVSSAYAAHTLGAISYPIQPECLSHGRNLHSATFCSGGQMLARALVDLRTGRRVRQHGGETNEVRESQLLDWVGPEQIPSSLHPSLPHGGIFLIFLISADDRSPALTR